MATGHLDPGYGDIVSRMKRVRSVVPCSSREGAREFRDAFQTDPDEASLDDIRSRARDMWLGGGATRTSYNDHYRERELSVDDITTTRPTSAGRVNKPHPSKVFLTTRLHNVPGYGRLNEIPGYQNPDTTIGKPAYQLDRSTSPWEQSERGKIRDKYIGRPHTAAVNQFRSIPELQAIKDPIARQGTEAFLKLASDEDRDYVLDGLRKKLDSAEHHYPKAPSAPYGVRPVASLHRYLRSAGARESQHINNVYNHQLGYHSYTPEETVATRRYKDIESYKNVKFHRGPSKRGDFLMHPEWTPKMSHHRLDGLSSLDVPYFPGRR